MDDSRNPMSRMFALGKVKRLMSKFENEKLDSENPERARLLKGFYTCNPLELEADKDDKAS